jgi:nickel-dependent lactate racemase
MKIELPQLIWYGNTTLEFELPPEWEVEVCPMRGADRRSLTEAEIEQALSRPLDSPPLEELAKKRRRAVIVFDDMTRPTRVFEIAPPVIRALLAGGMAERDITFVCALGTHGALTQNEFRKKLGRDVVERFRVFNHNCYDSCVEVGTTSRGTRVKVNREVMEADLRIGIGCVTAHAQAGFSGGGKIILPGVCHIDTVAHHHIEVEAKARETTGLGNYDRNVLRLNSEEAARLAGLDFKIDAVVNARGQTAALFAGEFLQAHAEAVNLARDACLTEPRPRDKDLAICNAFAKPNELAIAYLVGILALKRFTGTVVIIADAPEGQVVHYLLGRFGRSYGGPQYPVAQVLPSTRLIIQAPHPDRTFADWFTNADDVVLSRDWSATLRALGKSLGPHPRVAVLPSATMQYYG